MNKPGPKSKPESIKNRGMRKAFYAFPEVWKDLESVSKENNMEKSLLINEAISQYLFKQYTTPDLDNKHFSVVSLFSGCGGMDLGFKGDFKFLRQAYPSHEGSEGKTFKITFANDIFKDACAEYVNHFKQDHVLCSDIKAFLDNMENENHDRNLPFPNSADVVIGGFPCQDFSVSGKRKGFSSERGQLYKEMKRVVNMLNPKIFVAENVKGLTNLGEALDFIKKDFSKSGKFGYRIFSKLHHAADFGVPQTRERVFIVGVRKDLNPDFFEFPLETHSMNPQETGLKPWVTSEEAIGDLMDRPNVPNQAQYSKAKNYGAHCQGNRAIRADRPGPTIRAEHHGNIEFHYKLPRRLTVRECARIQSFPDEFAFISSPSAAYKVIGNAVPPVLAWHIARSVYIALEKWN